MDWYLVTVILLMFFAVIDLVVGVTNDAVNFLNPARASKVASFKVILLVASVGIICGVLFSGGMMEIARKGIFHPEFFTMPELMAIFLAVVCSDVILLDMFNLQGLPTSTTVAIVFNLLGAALAAATVKVISSGAGLSAMGQYINSSQAMTIIFGIVLSIVVAFICGAIAQLISRLIFTFNIESRIKRYGAIWGGVALAFIAQFIVIDGMKQMAFLPDWAAAWLQNNSFTFLIGVFVVSVFFLQTLLLLKLSIFKPIILTGTFALALAFASNDLVNFIGVPLAGLTTYMYAQNLPDPYTGTMHALAGSAQTPLWYLLTAGIVMVSALWFSKRSKTVSDTELNLSRQDEGLEKYESTPAARMIVRTSSQFLHIMKVLIPRPIFVKACKRLEMPVVKESSDDSGAYDLLRASVNLMVASAVVAFATSLKLPLSTTFVTFMVAMGTSFADQAWGRESAVYRVAGVLTVVSGWFLTAVFCCTMAFIFAMIIFKLEAVGVVLLITAVFMSLRRTSKVHKAREKDKQKEDVFNLKKITDPREAIATTFQQMATFLAEIQNGLNHTLEALCREDRSALRFQRERLRKVKNWSNVITANIFKTLRVLDTGETVDPHKYTQTIRCLQSVAEGYCDIVSRCYDHINDHHKSLLPVQVEEVTGLAKLFNDILADVEKMLSQEKAIRYEEVLDKHVALRNKIDEIYAIQIERIKDRTSKTRLTILFFAVIGNMRRISRQNLRLLEIFQESLLLGNEHSFTGNSEEGVEPLELS